MKRKFPVFFHDSVDSDEPIWVNAGKKGCLLKIGLKNLLFLTEGIMVDIVR
jgi:prolyl-tRNA editing enzyme YbaK/EbsC (Cys-tRNA(Pro) deacylase)